MCVCVDGIMCLIKTTMEKVGLLYKSAAAVIHFYQSFQYLGAFDKILLAKV